MLYNLIFFLILRAKLFESTETYLFLVSGGQFPPNRVPCSTSSTRILALGATVCTWSRIFSAVSFPLRVDDQPKPANRVPPSMFSLEIPCNSFLFVRRNRPRRPATKCFFISESPALQRLQTGALGVSISSICKIPLILSPTIPFSIASF